MLSLLISLHFHDGRYHGSGAWPPEPARLFQALVAGAARGRSLAGDMVAALEWLEGLEAPVIAAPPAYAAQSFKTFVPNNDLDSVNGDPARINEVRAGKIIRPRLFEAAIPLLYAWDFEPSPEADKHAKAICLAAENLYQLGRGVDMAWATGEIVGDAEARLAAHGCVVRRPAKSGSGEALACPCLGSLTSLTRRFHAMGERFKREGTGKKASLAFANPPKPEFRPVPYDSPSSFLVFDIRNGDVFAPHPLSDVVALTEEIRNRAAERLKQSAWEKDNPKREALIGKIFIGRESTPADKAQRIRITPLPSIGHTHVERSIRRILVTVRPDCPIGAGDIAWAFSGLAVDIGKETGEVLAELVPAAERSMLTFYGIGNAPPACLWRSVTPLALAERAARRRIDPARQREEAKTGAERSQEEERAVWAVRQALRHADIRTPAKSIRVQREPFEAKGKRVEAFAVTPRFAKERLWHVEIAFDAPVQGPLLIGDGRFLGLGLMARVSSSGGIFAFSIEGGLAQDAEPLALTRALRRAAMARVQDQLGKREMLPAFFSGHTEEGSPARSGKHEHLAFAYDAPRQRLLILAPHRLEHRRPSKEERLHWSMLEKALQDFRELRAGVGGKLDLAPEFIAAESDPLCAAAPVWESLTPYRVTRHAKKDDAKAALEDDLRAECQRAGLPKPRVEVTKTFAKPGLGLFGFAKLHFHSAVEGPLLLGRDRHFGGGLFGAAK